MAEVESSPLDDVIGRVLAEAKSNLVSLSEQEEALQGQLELVRTQKRRLNGIVRAGEGPKAGSKPGPKDTNGTDKSRAPRQETLDKIQKFIKDLPEDHQRVEGVAKSFGTGDLDRALGMSSTVAANALEHLRDQGQVRLAGQGGRNGRAKFYAPVGNGG